MHGTEDVRLNNKNQNMHISGIVLMYILLHSPITITDANSQTTTAAVKCDMKEYSCSTPVEKDCPEFLNSSHYNVPSPIPMNQVLSPIIKRIRQRRQ